jgi:hypothetical protein
MFNRRDMLKASAMGAASSLVPVGVALAESKTEEKEGIIDGQYYDKGYLMNFYLGLSTIPLKEIVVQQVLDDYIIVAKKASKFEVTPNLNKDNTEKIRFILGPHEKQEFVEFDFEKIECKGDDIIIEASNMFKCDVNPIFIASKAHPEGWKPVLWTELKKNDLVKVDHRATNEVIKGSIAENVRALPALDGFYQVTILESLNSA